MNSLDVHESYPMVDLDSDDDEGISSSEDEVDIILHGTPQQKRKLRRKSLGQDSSSEDEFEKEMDAELDRRMLNITAMQTGNKTPVQEQKTNPKAEEEFLGQDSDEDATEADKPGLLSNDELLYDPDLDEKDQEWVNRQRQSYQPRAADGGVKRRKKGPSSDATLVCPACMIVLCRDCQRHSYYPNQFRAMFVMNCSMDKTVILRYPSMVEKHKRKNKKNKDKSKPTKSDIQSTTVSNTGMTGGNHANAKASHKASSDGTHSGDQANVDISETASSSGDQANVETCQSDREVYHPVHCTQCTTQVGVFDSDEVYHFFNILESNG